MALLDRMVEVMGEKSRWGWVVPVCLRKDCVNMNTEVCKDCVPRFDYKRRVDMESKNVDMRKVQGKDLPEDKKTLRSS